jgi:exopolysaccharide biosynthesis protein
MGKAHRVALACIIALPLTARAQQWDSVSERTVAPGVIHKRVVANRGPWRINVLEIDLRQRGLSIRGMKANDNFVGREKVSSMVARYKGPGTVVAAINGDFFNIKTGESENNVVIEGDMSKGVTVSDSPYDTFNTLHSQFGVDWKNHPFIDRFGLTAILKQRGKSYSLSGVNFRPPWRDALVLFTAEAGDSSPPDTTQRVSAYLPLRRVSSMNGEREFAVAGPVTDGRRASLANGGVLIADGDKRSVLDSIATRGGSLRVAMSLVPKRGKLRTVIGGWPRIVRAGRSVAQDADVVEGTFPRFSSARHPRTGVGFSKDSATLYLVTVDGRRESDSGMSLAELADAMIQLGAYDAMNFDGGGSTTIVIDGKVVNHPSDQSGERPVGSALLIVEDRNSRSH